MTIHVDLQKVKNFALRHKEALAVAGVLLLINHKQAKRIMAMDKFLDKKGLHEEWCNQK